MCIRDSYGVAGCSEILREVDDEYDVVALACGTGTTLAGIVLSLPEGASAIGFSALKGGDFLKDEVQRGIESVLLDKDVAAEYGDSFSIETDYHFGGYAKCTPELGSFLHDFYRETTVKLDHVYTGKAMYGLLDRIKSRCFEPGTRILFIHTGGLQGSQAIWAAEQ